MRGNRVGQAYMFVNVCNINIKSVTAGLHECFSIFLRTLIAAVLPATLCVQTNKIHAVAERIQHGIICQAFPVFGAFPRVNGLLLPSEVLADSSHQELSTSPWYGLNGDRNEPEIRKLFLFAHSARVCVQSAVTT